MTGLACAAARGGIAGASQEAPHAAELCVGSGQGLEGDLSRAGEDVEMLDFMGASARFHACFFFVDLTEVFMGSYEWALVENIMGSVCRNFAKPMGCGVRYPVPKDLNMVVENI